MLTATMSTTNNTSSCGADSFLRCTEVMNGPTIVSMCPLHARLVFSRINTHVLSRESVRSGPDLDAHLQYSCRYRFAGQSLSWICQPRDMTSFGANSCQSRCAHSVYQIYSRCLQILPIRHRRHQHTSRCDRHIAGFRMNVAACLSER